MREFLKFTLCVGSGCALLLAGCGQNSGNDSKSTNAAASSGSPLTAPVDYLGAVTRAQQSAVKTAGTARINEATQLFSTDKGRYPKDLDELVTEKFIPQIPAAPYGMKYDYDPKTGLVTVVKQ
jgi:hypothetical protein